MFLGRHCVILPCHKEAPSSHKESAQRIMVANCINSYEVAEFSLETTIKYGAYDISLRGVIRKWIYRIWNVASIEPLLLRFILARGRPLA